MAMCVLPSLCASNWNCWMDISLTSRGNHRWFSKGVVLAVSESHRRSASSLALILFVFKIFCQFRGVVWGQHRNLFVVLFGFTSFPHFLHKWEHSIRGICHSCSDFFVLLPCEGRPLLIQPALGVLHYFPSELLFSVTQGCQFLHLKRIYLIDSYNRHLIFVF